MLIRQISFWNNKLTTVSKPVLQIRIRGYGFLNTDPDPDRDDPKKAGSDRIWILLRYVLDV